MAGLSFTKLCRLLGREPPYVRGLQRDLGLHVPDGSQGYSENYLSFMKKIVSLRALHVPRADIGDLFETEKKILQLLHVDSLTGSPTWYLDARGNEKHSHPAHDRLLLTGYRLGFAVDGEAVQHTLDFGQRHPELFKGSEMGEDLRRVLEKYRRLLDGVGRRVQKERPVLKHALHWAGQALVRGVPAP